ncbi:hypothetical protein GCM10027047_13530 [Rhodococcus aerolatus]
MSPTPPPLAVSPAALRAAARTLRDAAARSADATTLVERTRLTSVDVGAEGDAVRAAVHRLADRAGSRLAALATALDDDAARLVRCAQDYVSSDTVAAHRLAGPR